MKLIFQIMVSIQVLKAKFRNIYECFPDSLVQVSDFS